MGQRYATILHVFGSFSEISQKVAGVELKQAFRVNLVEESVANNIERNYSLLIYSIGILRYRS